MSLTDKQKSKAVWGWNKHRDTRKIAVTLGVTVDVVQAYLETCTARGYPDRIRLYTPAKKPIALAPVPKGWS